MHRDFFLKEPWENIPQKKNTSGDPNDVILKWILPKCNVNDHHAETASKITFKFGLLTTPLSDNITSKFHYFSIKTKKCYMEEKKTHKFPKNGSETGQVTSSNYVMTLCLI